MSDITQKKVLKNLLLRKSNKSRLWMAWTTLCVGTTLLLLAVLIWWNFRELLYGKNDKDSLGSTFITVSKIVTSENMGKPALTVFSQEEINEMKKAPNVQDVGLLTSNRFPAYIRLNSALGFSSDIFLESVPDPFIDKKSEDWNWQMNSREVPIILSAEFLNLYNYGFALSQGLPQLSEATIQSLAFDLILGSPENRETYTAHVVGFSDRITSVLVPQKFMQYANEKYGNASFVKPSRLIVKVTDPSDKSFVEFLKAKDYVTNAENLRWNKLRSVVEVIVASTGVLALLLMGISALVFILFIELTIARAQQSLELLLQIGYNPAYLKKFMMRRFLPLMLGAVIVALLLAFLAQRIASLLIVDMNLQLPTIPGYPIWIAASISIILLFLQIKLSVGKALKEI